MPTIRKPKPAPADAPKTGPVWPYPMHPTAEQIHDQASPFYVDPDLVDDYCTVASDPAKFRDLDRREPATENRLINVRRLLIDTGLMPSNPPQPRKGQPMQTSNENDRIRKHVAEVERDFGVNQDGMHAHFLAVREARQRVNQRQVAANARKFDELRTRCACCKEIDSTSRKRDRLPVSSTPIARAKAEQLCDACWWAILQIAAEKDRKTQAAAAFYATL